MAGLAGCSFASDPTPAATDLEAVNLGSNAEIGPVTVSNILLVTRGNGEPARILGTLGNNSSELVSITIADADDSVTVELGAEQILRLQDSPVLLDTADERPGARVPLVLSVEESTTELSTPVRNGSLEFLEPYLPEASGNR